MKIIKKVLIVIFVLLFLVLLDFLSLFIFNVKLEKITTNHIPPNTYYIKRGKVVGLYYVKTYHSTSAISPIEKDKGYYSYGIWIKTWYKYIVKEN